jgi:biopolymer transport protein ExbD
MLLLLVSSFFVACTRPEAPAPAVCPPCASARACPSPVVVASAVALDAPAPTADSNQGALLQIDVLVNGEVHANGSKVDGGPVTLLAIAQKAHAANPQVRAIIRADREVTHGRVIAVLDTLKQAGISRIAFAVSPAAPAPSSKP